MEWKVGRWLYILVIGKEEPLINVPHFPAVAK